MDASLAAVLDFYLFPTGRRLFALAQVAQRAKTAGHAELAKHCNVALAEDRKCLALERRWAGFVAESKGKAAAPAAAGSPPAAAKTDALVDRTLTAIRDHAESQRAGAAPDDPIHATVTAFLNEIYPSGSVQDVTVLPFVEELAAVDHILTLVQGPGLAPVVAELGLQRLVKRLAALTEQYRTALQAPAPETIAYGEVRALRAAGQERLLQAVAIILGKHYRSTPADVAARAELLGPILEQSAAIGAHMRSRRTVEDVNPETGEPDPNATAPVPPAGNDP